MQDSCRTILPLGVAIVVTNQKRNDAMLRNRSPDLFKADWLSQKRSPDELRGAEYSQTIPRLTTDQSHAKIESFGTLFDVISCLHIC